LGAEVAVDEFQRAVGELPRQHGVGEADVSEDALQRFALSLWVRSPVPRIGLQVLGADPAKFLDAVTDVHGAGVALTSRPPRACFHDGHSASVRAARTNSSVRRPVLVRGAMQGSRTAPEKSAGSYARYSRSYIRPSKHRRSRRLTRMFVARATSPLPPLLS